MCSLCGTSITDSVEANSPMSQLRNFFDRKVISLKKKICYDIFITIPSES